MKWTSSNTSYDGAGNVTNIHDVTAASTTVNFNYAYDVASELTQEIDNGSATTLYSYDATGELVSAGSTSYNYDSNGNPTNTGDVVGVNNELLSDGTYNYTYDNVGNEITKTDIATSDTWTYTYNNGNQLTSAVETNSSSQIENEVDYEYDVFGNKIEATTVVYTTAGYSPSATTSTTKYAIDQWNPGNDSGVASVWADLNSSNGLQSRYIGTNNVNQLVARIDVSGTVGTAYWYLEDRQNSTRDIITNSAALVDTINYNAYGNILPGYETSPTYGGTYKYTGEQFDSVTGLQYNNARWYDPNTGRWMSQDPEGFAAGDSNLYRYVKNSPMDGVDPSGRQEPGFYPDIGNSLENSKLTYREKMAIFKARREKWEEARANDAKWRQDNSLSILGGDGTLIIPMDSISFNWSLKGVRINGGFVEPTPPVTITQLIADINRPAGKFSRIILFGHGGTGNGMSKGPGIMLAPNAAKKFEARFQWSDGGNPWELKNAKGQEIGANTVFASKAAWEWTLASDPKSLEEFKKTLAAKLTKNGVLQIASCGYQDAYDKLPGKEKGDWASEVQELATKLNVRIAIAPDLNSARAKATQVGVDSEKLPIMADTDIYFVNFQQQEQKWVEKSPK